MWSSVVQVYPWVGKSFETPKHFPRKTLLLGESNFTETELFGTSLVQDCVIGDISDHSENRDTNGFCRFSTKIRRILFDSEVIDPSNLWGDVAFYNFVQFLVGGKSRIRPTQEMWKRSVPAFNEIVSKLDPLQILVLGKANWNNLLTHIEHERIDEFMAKLNVGGNWITAIYINHPSSSLSYSKWRPIAKRILV
jgi:hypothetical protein